MNVTRFFTLAALLILLTLQAAAQNGREVTLFELAEDQPSAMKLPAHETGRQYITLTPAAMQRTFLQAGDILTFEADSELRRFEVERVSSYTDDTYSITARSLDGAMGHLTYTLSGHEGQLQGKAHIPGRQQLWHLGFDSGRQSNYIAAVDADKLDILSCPVEGGPGVPVRDSKKRDGVLPEALADQHSTIDLLIAYTSNARDWMEANGGVNLIISQAMNNSQQALDNSNVPITLNLVYQYETTGYDESTDGSTSTTLDKLAATNDGVMDEVHGLRNQYGADLVALFAEVSDVGGIAYLLQDEMGLPASGFSVDRVQQAHISYTVVHEIGHNLGNHHSRNQTEAPAPDPPDGGLFEYSTGWRWTGDDGIDYVSVMTYEEGDTRVPYFSDPDITYQGVPTGAYSGTYAPADNVRSMEEIRATVAGYRTLMTTPGTPSLSSPSDGAVDLPLTPTLSWSGEGPVDSYTVQVSTDSGFGSRVIDRNQTGTDFTPSSPLGYLTTYYWRVKAENEAGESGWSEVRSFTTIIEAPGTVELLSPADGEFQVPLNTELSWMTADRAAYYEVQVSKNMNFSEDNEFSSTVSEPVMNSDSPFSPSTEYFWRVKAGNRGGESDWSDTTRFVTLVEETGIEKNYPNPFNGATTIRYQIAKETDVTLEVYDTIGRRVAVLVNERQQPRVYTVRFNSDGRASGMYLLRIRAGNFTEVQKVTIIR